jgi:hypothetical protein
MSNEQNPVQPLQPQVAQEPVAWRARGYGQYKTGQPGPWGYKTGAERPKYNNPECCDIEPLYAAPAVAQEPPQPNADAHLTAPVQSEGLPPARPEGTRDASGVPPGEWDGLSPKQAWWAGYRVGKGLPPDMPRVQAVAVSPNHQGD